MPDNLLSTKLITPITRPELVTRNRLISQLDRGLYKKLSLISAPAGFGKTTLVADWVEGIRLAKEPGSQINPAWLSLDEADNDRKRFLTYFLEALVQTEGVDSENEQATLAMLQAHNPPPLETLFTPLLNSLSGSPKKIILILDDYHLIESQAVHQVLNFWLEMAPPQVHTVVITREDPPFPLTRLRAGSQMTEIRAADLRFTASEAAHFFNHIMGLQLDARSVAALEERTEGWIVGLQMAGLSLQDNQNSEVFIKRFSGTNRYILDYLLEEVLANQSPEIQGFLLQTSILRQLSGPLCDAILDKDQGSTAALDYLEKSNLFLIPLDDQRSWYRYHHLFSDLLRARLQQTHSSQDIAALQRRAAGWHEAQGMAFGAIYHASLIPDDQWVERIIDQNYMEIFQRKDSALIKNWTGELGQELLFKRPQLAIHEANSRAWFGQLDEAELLLNEAEKRLDSPIPSPETQAMLGYLSYVRSRVTAMRGDFSQAIQLCLQASKNTPDSNLGLLGGIGVMLGYGYFLNGEFGLADQTLQETIQTGSEVGAINTTIGAYCVLARLYAIQGQLQRAYKLYQEGENLIRQSEGEHRGAMSIIDVGFAEILYEWNQLDPALTHIQKGLQYLPLWSKADDFALAYTLQAKIQRAQGDPPAAEVSLAKAAQVIQSSGVFSEARDAVQALEMEFGPHQGDPLAVQRWIRSAQTRRNQEGPIPFADELILITLAGIHLTEGSFQEGLELLADLEESARAGGRKGRLIQITLLQALTHHQAGTPEQAFPILEETLSLAEPEGYLRTFLEQGAAAESLLQDWLVGAESSTLSRYVKGLLSRFDREASAGPEGEKESALKGRLIEELTQRELEVLTLIATGKTNKEISAELVVSPGTVKAHTSNIYRKLDVSNRTEAVSRARELGLLP